MTDFRPHFPTREDAERYVRALADELRLKDWRITVADEPCDDHAQAQVSIPYGRRCAIIYISPEDCGIEGARQAIVHELLHCHFEPINWAVNNAADPLGSLAFGVLEGSVSDATELAIDTLAEAIAPMLPLPGALIASGAIWAEGHRPLIGARSVTYGEPKGRDLT